MTLKPSLLLLVMQITYVASGGFFVSDNHLSAIGSLMIGTACGAYRDHIRGGYHRE